MSNVRLILLLLAFMFFVLSALEIKAPRVDLTALGLALATLALLLGHVS